MYCSYCGQKVSSDGSDKYCRHCGAKFGKEHGFPEIAREKECVKSAVLDALNEVAKDMAVREKEWQREGPSIGYYAVQVGHDHIYRCRMDLEEKIKKLRGDDEQMPI